MSKRTTMSRIGDFFDVFGSAVAASRAVQAGKAPRRSDLQVLGIDPNAFKNIRQ